MKLVANSPEYWEFIRELRNNEAVKQGFIQQAHISPEEHIAFMTKHCNKFIICLIENQPAGYAGVIDRDIRIAVEPKFQKMGVGKFLIESLMAIYPDSIAKVKVENKASLKLFEKCGFKKKYYILER